MPELYYRARYYDPQGGRFISEDPLNFRAGIDFYEYVRNRPIVWRDPRGKDPVIGTIVGGISGGIYGAMGAYLGGGSRDEIIAAAALGAGIGAVVGAVSDPFGITALTVVGGAVGGFSDAMGQLGAGAGKGCKRFNWGSFAGSVVGGAIAGRMGGVISAAAAGTGISEAAAAAGGAAIGGAPSVFIPLAGAQLGASSPLGCGCQTGGAASSLANAVGGIVQN